MANADINQVRISFTGQLDDKQKEMLDDAFNVMGMQAAANEGLMDQAIVDVEIARLEAKYKC